MLYKLMGGRDLRVVVSQPHPDRIGGHVGLMHEKQGDDENRIS